MCFVFTPAPGKSYCRGLGSLVLCLFDIFQALINYLVCGFSTFTFSAVGGVFCCWSLLYSTVLRSTFCSNYKNNGGRRGKGGRACPTGKKGEEKMLEHDEPL